VFEAKRQILLAASQVDEQRVRREYKCQQRNVTGRPIYRDRHHVPLQISDVSGSAQLSSPRRNEVVAKGCDVYSKVGKDYRPRPNVESEVVAKECDVDSEITKICDCDVTHVNQFNSVVRVRVPVPLRVVGLVVGRRGDTIKRIQEETRTSILSPDKLQTEPVFVVSGLRDNVARARLRIERCISSDKCRPIAYREIEDLCMVMSKNSDVTACL